MCSGWIQSSSSARHAAGLQGRVTVTQLLQVLTNCSTVFGWSRFSPSQMFL
jgi:hypothetical protein